GGGADAAGVRGQAAFEVEAGLEAAAEVFAAAQAQAAGGQQAAGHPRGAVAVDLLGTDAGVDAAVDADAGLRQCAARAGQDGQRNEAVLHGEELRLLYFVRGASPRLPAPCRTACPLHDGRATAL